MITAGNVLDLVVGNTVRYTRKFLLSLAIPTSADGWTITGTVAGYDPNEGTILIFWSNEPTSTDIYEALPVMRSQIELV